MTNELLENVYLSSLSYLQPLTLEERYKIAVQEAIRVAGANNGSIFLLDPQGEFVRAYSDVPPGSQVQPRKSGNTRRAVEEEKLKIVQGEELKKAHLKLYNKGIKCLILIPLSFNKQTIGVLSLQAHEAKQFGNDMLGALRLFGALLSLGIRNSQLYEESIGAIEARDLFISLASHELRTPLTTISAYAGLIEKKLNNKQFPPPKSVEILRSEIKRLKNIVNELLAIEQVKTGQLRYAWKEVAILNVLKKAVINFKFNYPGYKVLLENPVHHKIVLARGDEEKLQQVFTNLLNNSAKFSSSVTPIVLTVGEDEKYVSISITDYGKGIRKREQDKVFVEFFKAKGNYKEGMGLGLFLVKNIIDKHKGKVSLTSKLHVGTTITVSLPK